ncbi:MAG: hypothetical protein QME94_09870, partial [Anaerolineae bacterium]|nr:hypothetical protein [Anaerolineae bacterium]
SISLQRLAPSGRVTVCDELVAVVPRTLESAVITLARAQEGAPGLVRIRGQRGALHIRYDPASVVPRIETLPAADLSGGPLDVQRVAFAWREPRRQGEIRLEFVPE